MNLVPRGELLARDCWVGKRGAPICSVLEGDGTPVDAGPRVGPFSQDERDCRIGRDSSCDVILCNACPRPELSRVGVFAGV